MIVAHTKDLDSAQDRYCAHGLDSAQDIDSAQAIQAQPQ